jgi:tRNA uridine 5-carboxymethylaminomethyl modification enzyme
MFTSRAEFRLLLRQDNADRRLTLLAHKFGLIDAARWQRLQDKEDEIRRGFAILSAGREGDIPLDRFLKRPEVEWADCAIRLPELASISRESAVQITYDLKYAGYVQRQEQQVARQKRLEHKKIPASFDYRSIQHLRVEAREKLSRIRPVTLAQAGRISGITPADMALVLAHLEGK